MSRLALSWVVIGTLVLGGCGKYLDEILPDKQKEYRKSQSLPDLEIPPELSSESIKDTMAVPEIDKTGTAVYSTYQERITAERKAQTSDSKTEASSVEVLPNEKLLIIPGKPSEIWPRLRSFWTERGYTFELDDQELGVLETKWLEDRTELTRDRFKVFMEPGEEGGTTALYISHVKEALEPEGEELIWREQPRDNALEEGVVMSLKAFLADSQATPQSPEISAMAPLMSEPKQLEVKPSSERPALVTSPNQWAQLVHAGEGKLYLTLPEDFASAWRSTGHALNKAGLKIEDEDRSRGVYYVRYLEGREKTSKNKGGWSRLAFWKNHDKADQYQVSLTGVGNKTEVVVLDWEGNWDHSEEAEEILNRLHAVLNNANSSN